MPVPASASSTPPSAKVRDTASASLQLRLARFERGDRPRERPAGRQRGGATAARALRLRIQRELAAQGFDFRPHHRQRRVVFGSGERARDELGDRSISGSRMPRVVTAGVPMRMPLVTIGGFVSNGIVFLLTVMPALSSAASATLPVRPFEVTSTSIRWLSVPPETRRKPRAGQLVRPAPGRWRRSAAGSRVKPGSSASSKQTALAAMTCISGPPWMPGKTARSRSFAYWLAAQDDAAARAAQRLVRGGGDEVGNAAPGSGAASPATSPAMCAMSMTIGDADSPGRSRRCARSR